MTANINIKDAPKELVDWLTETSKTTGLSISSIAMGVLFEVLPQYAAQEPGNDGNQKKTA